ncbi:MAG: hypothetical protein ACI378_03230 [Bacteroides sp.]
MADILKFTIINKKMTLFCEKASSKQVVFGLYFALCGRFVADNRCFFHQKSTYFAATITVITVVPPQLSKVYNRYGTTVA